MSRHRLFRLFTAYINATAGALEASVLLRLRMAKPTKEEELAAIKESFDALDEDGDGLIQVDGSQVLPSDDDPATRKSVDANGKRSIDFQEYLIMMTREMEEYERKSLKRRNDVREACEKKDSSNSGLIGMDDLRNILKGLSEEIDEAYADQLMRDADVDPQGNINYKDFVEKMAN